MSLEEFRAYFLSHNAFVVRAIVEGEERREDGREGGKKTRMGGKTVDLYCYILCT